MFLLQVQPQIRLSVIKIRPFFTNISTSGSTSKQPSINGTTATSKQPPINGATATSTKQPPINCATATSNQAVDKDTVADTTQSVSTEKIEVDEDTSRNYLLTANTNAKQTKPPIMISNQTLPETSQTAQSIKELPGGLTAQPMILN